MKKNNIKSNDFRVLLYYRDEIPLSLVQLVDSNSFISLTKDGIKEYNNHRCPRATLFISDSLDNKNTKKVQALLKTLEVLVINNQIVGFIIKTGA